MCCSVFFIATPSWNYGRFLGDALESVRLQAGESVLHHVQDAVSADDTAGVLARHAWPGLSWVHEPDDGQCDALNRAFARAPAEAQYLGWLNADEFYLEGALAVVRRTFEENPDIDVVYGDSLHVDESGRLTRLVAQHGMSRTVLRSMRHLYIQTSSTFFRRRVLESGDLRLDLGYRQAMDHELFARLDAAGYRFAHVRVPLSGFRVHDAQLTARHGSATARDEFRAVQRQLGYGARPRLARTVHRVMKVANGAYVRELRHRRFRGESLRWFTDPTHGMPHRKRAPA